MRIRELFVDQVLYHVSPSENDRKIMEEGLRPKTGERSKSLGDFGIFLFKDMDSLEDALMNWLGKEFEDVQSVTIWQVIIPDSNELKQTSAGYEFLYTNVIPPTHLELIRREEL